MFYIKKPRRQDIKVPNKECYWRNPEYYREKTREYYADNASKMAEAGRAWAEKNPDKAIAIKRRYYLKNKELIIQKNKRRKKDLKIQCVQYLGSVCNKCQLDTDCLDVYCFHHRCPSDKDFSLSTRRTSTFEAIKKELDKCELLCVNCHRKEHKIQHKDRHARYRARRKQKAVDLFGRACTDCRLVDDPCVYDFHHPDASVKDFSFRDSRSWESTAQELKKCVILCANCHKRRHANKSLQDFRESSPE